MCIDTTKIEDRAVRAVGDYIDDCPKLKSYCQSNDKTPVWDGDIIIYKSKEHNVRNIFARVPLQIKGTTSSDDDSYRIEREYLEAYQSDRGCVFFMVQEDKETYKAIRILYAMLSLKDVNALLQHNTQTIKIDLQETPDDCSIFEEELIKFAKKRNGEKLDDPAPKEIASLLKRFKEVEQHLDEVEDNGVRYELESYLNTILGLRNDGTVGWRDKFIYLARKVLDLTLQHIKGYDALSLQFELGYYLQQQKLYHLVEVYYSQALEQYRERAKESPVYKVFIVGILNNLGLLHSALNQYAAAEKEYQEALDIYRKLANCNSNAYMAFVATTLNNLGNLHSNLNQYAAAEKEYKEALETYRKLAKDNPNALLGKVAMTLNNLGYLHYELNQYAAAEKEYQEALDIYKKLTKVNTDAYLADVAMTLNHLAVLHKALIQYDDAEKEFQKALDIFRKLAKDNLDAYLADVAMTLNNLAILHSNLNQYAAAEKEYKEALEIYRKLAKDYPDAYLADVAATLNNLGSLHRDLNQYAAAEKEYQEALVIRRELAKDNPDAYLGDVAITLDNIALLMMQDERRIDEAKQAAQEALVLFKVMAQKTPQRWNQYVDIAQVILNKINGLL